MELISFVIPCYRSENTIKYVIDEIIEIMSSQSRYEYEIIAINDGSPDNVYDVLSNIANNNKKVKVVNFSKNMGKHSAVLAGYKIAQGKYVVDLDDDYQCPLNEFWKLLKPLEDDLCDVSVANYTVKKEGIIKRIGSCFNKKMVDILLERPRNIKFENFSIRKKYVCDEMIKYQNPYPFLEGLTLRVTHRIMCVPMEERNRIDNGKTGFTFTKSLALFFNGLTAFSVKPLRIASAIGTLVSILGFIWGIITIIRKFINPNIAEGYSSILAVILFIGGLNMVMLGLVGEYIGRIYISINRSPQYVIKDTINIDK